MSLISFPFLVFLAVLIPVFYLTPRRFRYLTLIVFNCIFIGCAGIKSLLFISVTAVSVWAAALRLSSIDGQMAQRIHAAADRTEKKTLRRIAKHRKQLWIFLTLLLNFGIWAFFKLLICLNGLEKLELSAGSFLADSEGSLFVPFAISYYTFIAVGYLIDVYRGMQPQRNFLKLFAFLTFFPQMTEGPFTRYQTISDTMYEGRSFSLLRLEEGCVRIVWGLCKKMVVADRLWTAISSIPDNEAYHTGPLSAIFILLIPLQQYMDFSGCMDIVLGAAHILGIDLEENFRQPIFSKSIAEVWRRWHITLCKWFKDYLFYPAATAPWMTSLQKKVRRISPKAAATITSVLSMLIVWTVTGLWHGLAWKNLFWGWMNFIVLASSLVLTKTYTHWHERTGIRADSTGWKIFAMIRTYCLFALMETMADVTSAAEAFSMYKAVFTPSSWHLTGIDPNTLFGGMTRADFILIGIICALVFLEDLYKEKKSITGLSFQLAKIPVPVRSLLFTGILFCVLMLSTGGEGVQSGFAYAKF